MEAIYYVQTVKLISHVTSWVNTRIKDILTKLWRLLCSLSKCIKVKWRKKVISYANNKGGNHKWGRKVGQKRTFSAHCWLLCTVNWSHYYPPMMINPVHSSVHLISSIWAILRLFALMLAWPAAVMWHRVKDWDYWKQAWLAFMSSSNEFEMTFNFWAVR